MATLTITNWPALQEVGPGRGRVLSNGLREDGQAMRVDGTYTENSIALPVQVEVRTQGGPFHFDQGKQYTVTITEVV